MKESNKKSRFQFAPRREQQTWKKVLPKLSLLICIQNAVYRQKPTMTTHHPEHTISMGQHGGGRIMLWQLLSSIEEWKLAKVDGNMDGSHL